jgi:hypothetical protein
MRFPIVDRGSISIEIEWSGRKHRGQDTCRRRVEKELLVVGLFFALVERREEVIRLVIDGLISIVSDGWLRRDECGQVSGYIEVDLAMIPC